MVAILAPRVQVPDLKAHRRGADWINKTIKKKRIKQGSVISLYSEIHEDDNDLIPFILETKYDPRAKRFGNYSKARALFLISTSQLANHNHDSVPLKGLGPSDRKTGGGGVSLYTAVLDGICIKFHLAVDKARVAVHKASRIIKLGSR